MRFENESVNILTAEFLPDNNKTRGKAPTPRNRMKIFLRYIADLGFQNKVPDELFGVECSSVSKFINCIMDHILETAHNWVYFPNRVQEVNNTKFLWQT